jgi:apolipoprotein N-acyltransferase
MWRPFSQNGAIADWFDKKQGIALVDGKRIGVLICYEPYLFLPPLMTMLGKPDVLVAVSNSWWSRGTNIPAISDGFMKSWALLFNVPLVISRNI